VTEAVSWLPLSAAQRQVWTAQSLEPVRSRHKIGQYLEILGPVDPVRLEAAVRKTFAEAEAIQVRCDADGTRQAIDQRTDWAFPVVDLANAADPAADPVSLAEEQMRRGITEQIDLARGQLFATALYRLGPERYLLLHAYHQFAMDAVSVYLVAHRVAALYSGAEERARFGPLARLLASDQDYRASPRFAADRRYWLERIGDLPGRPARVANGTRSTAEDTIRCSSYLTPAVIADLKGGSRPAHNLAASVVAATAAYLHRLTGANDVIIGFPVTARSDPALRDIPGMVSNLLPLRVRVPDGILLADLLREASQAVFETLGHGRYRGEDIVRDIGFRGTLRDYVGPQVNIFPFPYDLRFAGYPAIPRNLTPGVVDDLTVAVYDRADGRDVKVELSAGADLFEPGELALHQERFGRLLSSFGRSGDLRRPVGAVDIFSPTERSQVLVQWPGRQGDMESVVPDMFEAQADRTPDAQAVAWAGGTLTYAELNARANRLARLLIERGAGPESLVAVLLPRSAELVVALLAVLKAGAAYLPVNPDYPAQRIGLMLDDAQPALVLTSGTVEVAGGLRLPGCLFIDSPEVSQALSRYPDANPADADRLARLTPRSPAYVLYTSGSTGVPKGVEVEQRSLANYLDYCASAYPALRGHTLLHSPVSFDLAVTSLFGTLVSGGCLHIAALDEDWPARAAGRPTFLKVTPSHLPVLATLPAECAPDAELMIAGEALTGELLEDWRRDHPGVDVVNSYGPTETTVACADYRIAAADEARPGPVPIGRPIKNVRVYVLDTALEPVPPGATGELFIAGAGVARGYRKRPGFTAERFLPDPYGRPGRRMYRTGDRVRWRTDGNLEFLGRADDQVKLRGFRVELGEVESILSKHPDLDRAAVAVREDRPGDRRLVGYIVPMAGHAVAAPDIRKYLQEQLPDYMVPGALVTLPGLPLTPNGKLDRQALPAPDVSAWHVYREPRSPQEEILCDLFAEVLGLPSVGVDDDFFDLGGHSLLVIRLISRVRDTLGADLTIRDVFDEPTVAGLARHLAAGQQAWPALRPAAQRPDVLPLSFAQRRLWFSYRLEGPSPTYNIPLPFRIAGPLDRQALAAALGDLVGRHEPLRTVYPQVNGIPRQLILDPQPGRPELIVTAIEESQIEDVLAEAVGYSFDLATEPQLRARLFAISPDDHVLLLLLHHIATDGWSLGPLARDLAAAYAARRRGEAPDFPPLPVQYADYTLWQNDLLGEKANPDSRIGKQLGYWEQALRDVPAELELPADRPRPPVPSYRGGRYRFGIQPALHRGIADLARDEGASVFMVLQAGLSSLLTRMGAGTDLPIGVPVAGRTEEVLDDLVGLFLNTLVLRTDTSGDPDFRALVQRIRDADLDAYANQEVPFDYLVEMLNPTRTLARNPLFHVVITFQSQPRSPVVFEGCQTTRLRVTMKTARFDLSVSLRERRDADGTPDGIDASVEYTTDLFDEATIAALMQRLVRLLTAVIADPDQPISHASILSDEERQRLVTEWSTGDY
jgi:nonribosomal peptide synthetase DhbF